MKIWNGVFKNFKDTGIDYIGFHDPIWFKKQIEEINQKYFKNSRNENLDNDYSIDYFLIALLSVKKQINVCDFGGAMGQVFLRIKNKVSINYNVRFDVIESIETINYLPQSLKEIEGLSFYTEFQFKDYDILHLGSVIQYIENIDDFFKKISLINSEYILINDLLAGDIPTYTTIQNYYNNPIPVTWYNFDFINSELEKFNYELISKSKYKVKILGEENLRNLTSVPEEYRIDHSLNLIYKKRKI